MTTTAQTQQVFTKTFDEKILVVQRSKLFPQEIPQGFYASDAEHFYALVSEHKEFLWRSQMEVDPTYKQIIPLIVFTHDKKLFLMQRSAKAGDARLSSKYTLGIGGHVREEDMQQTSLAGWAEREFTEEVHYTGALKITPLGMINDESNAVGQVHTGFIFLAHGEHDDISIKSELQNGSLRSIDECLEFYDAMESWTKIVFDFLRGEGRALL